MAIDRWIDGNVSIAAKRMHYGHICIVSALLHTTKGEKKTIRSGTKLDSLIVQIFVDQFNIQLDSKWLPKYSQNLQSKNKVQYFPSNHSNL